MNDTIRFTKDAFSVICLSESKLSCIMHYELRIMNFIRVCRNKKGARTMSEHRKSYSVHFPARGSDVRFLLYVNLLAVYDVETLNCVSYLLTSDVVDCAVVSLSVSSFNFVDS